MTSDVRSATTIVRARTRGLELAKTRIIVAVVLQHLGVITPAEERRRIDIAYHGVRIEKWIGGKWRHVSNLRGPSLQ